MAFIGVGGIWDQDVGDFVLENQSGDAAGLALAKAITGGVVHIGPGLEGLVLGAWGANIALVRVTNTGIYAISRLHVADGTDPTKLLRFDASAIGAGVTRVATIPNWSGVLLLPADFGSGPTQFLRSNGAGTQPSFAAVSIINALLDGANHSDTVAQAVLRGALIVGNSTPAWARLPIGAANSLLKSDGVDPSWGAIALLSAFHSDTLGAAPVRGDLIVANSTPAWARFAKGAADTFLGSDGTDLQWRTAAAIAALLEHNALFHLKPFTATSVSMGAGSNQLVTTGGQFANVRVGDRINLDDAHYPSSVYGMRVTALIDSNNVTMDLTNTGGAQSGATATIFPGDHWDHTLMAGLLSSGGYGTFDEGANPGGTIPNVYGSFDCIGYGGSGTQRWGFEGATTGSNPNGFNWKRRGSSSRCFVHVQNLTANRFVKMPDLDGTWLLTDGAQNVTDKKLIGNNEIQCDDVVGNSTGSHFADVNDPTKDYYFDFTGITAGTGKKAKWADLSAGGHVDFTYVSQTTGINGAATGTTTLYTVPSGKSLVVTRVIVRCTSSAPPATGPTFGIGIAAGEDDIVASAAHAAFVAANTFVNCAIKDPAVVATSTQAIKLGIDTAAAGGAMTLAVELAGYLV